MFDNDKTEIVASKQRDDFDDDDTEVVHRGTRSQSAAASPHPDAADTDATEVDTARTRFDHFDDDDTEVVRLVSHNANRTHNTPGTTTPRLPRDEFDDDETDVVRHRPRLSIAPNPTQVSPAASALNDPRVAPRSVQRSRGTSLRDRVPEARAPWQPPDRLRSPEFEHRPNPEPSSNRLLLALAALSGVAALVGFLARPAQEADEPQQPTESVPAAEEVVPADGS
jgi:hypothetical protein